VIGKDDAAASAKFRYSFARLSKLRIFVNFCPFLARLFSDGRGMMEMVLHILSKDPGEKPAKKAKGK
jgi:hypothetical protein